MRPLGSFSSQPTGHLNPGVEAVIYCLDGWVDAIVAGTTHLRLPDYHYQRSRGRQQWTEAELERLVIDLDAEVEKELAGIGATVRAKAGPGFEQLLVPQRLALAQELDMLLKWHESALASLESQDVTVQDCVPGED